ncbi:lipopolysaccharide assembly protein B [Thermotomaculum hydrothermale]|uniref:Lipopolysaccharide assembly protein B n=1 Tax=Thermotomaculum hydrothermale TaxID=981385 RepID=A0A7R6SZB4_9BACT|nr:hypothetical protein [Thermotomaculum hydrothermale]BBB32567.1 lipopolysaccharide assembly protein B [Thermotomaculum hydrothermale]
MGIIILLSILIILVVLLFIIVTRDESKDSTKNEERLDDTVILILDKLQRGDLEKIEGLFKEILKKDSSKVEFYVILANIIRENGYISEAISIHKSILKRHDVLENKILKGWVLGNLAEDFRKGGMIDRALRTYKDALALLSEKESAPFLSKMDNKQAKEEDHVTPAVIWRKSLLERYMLLCKQVGDYEKLLSLIDIYNSTGGYSDENIYKREVAFVYNQLGEDEVKNENTKKAIEYFKKGLSIYRQLYPAYINLAKIYKDTKKQKAIQFLEQLIEEIPSKGFLILPLYKELAPKKFEQICNELINSNENDWRVRLELGRYYMEEGEKSKGLLEFKKCLEISPMVLIIHQEIWKYLLKHPEEIEIFKEYANTLNKVLVFNNPFICSKCNYKSSEFLWKCPYCHEFDTFVELKI